MVGINDIPVEIILNWPRPNYKNPETRGDAFLVITTLFLALASIFVGLRIYSRVVVRPWFGLDDKFILLALVRCTFLDIETVSVSNIDLLDCRNWPRHCG
jgi:hypothetical protein